MTWLTDLFAWLVKYVGAIGLAVTWIGIGLVYWRRRHAWTSKQFQDQINFSLNYVLGGELVMRTLLETKTANVWLNDFGIKKLLVAAQKTTLDQPFIELADQQDMDFVNRAVKNALSERFGSTFVAQSLGKPVTTGTFLFGITYERYEDMRTLKFRVLIVEEKALLAMFDGSANVRVANNIMQARFGTLRALHQRHLQGQNAGKKIVDRVQLGIC